MGTVLADTDTKMAGKLILLLGLIAGAWCQDTHHCPDGWHVSDISGSIECILLSGLEERVTKEDAVAICAYHEGWLVDMDEGHGPEKNRFLRHLVTEAAGQGDAGWPGPKFDDQWWIGATVQGHHSDHQYGNYYWNDWGCDQIARYICERAPLEPLSGVRGR